MTNAGRALNGHVYAPGPRFEVRSGRAGALGDAKHVQRDRLGAVFGGGVKHNGVGDRLQRHRKPVLRPQRNLQGTQDMFMWHSWLLRQLLVFTCSLVRGMGSAFAPDRAHVI